MNIHTNTHIFIQFRLIASDACTKRIGFSTAVNISLPFCVFFFIVIIPIVGFVLLLPLFRFSTMVFALILLICFGNANLDEYRICISICFHCKCWINFNDFTSIAVEQSRQRRKMQKGMNHWQIGVFVKRGKEIKPIIQLFRPRDIQQLTLQQTFDFQYSWAVIFDPWTIIFHNVLVFQQACSF